MNTEPNAMDAVRLKRLEEASEWLLRMRDPTRTERDIGDWLSWCDTDPANLEAFETFSSDWDDLDALKTDPEMLDRSETRLRSSRRNWPRDRPRLAIAAGVAVIAFTTVFLYRKLAPPVLPQQVVAEATNRSATLPDGSKVILGAKTRVTFELTGNDRNLELSEGEAYFKVKHDRRHPFTVHAGAIDVMAIGTAFDIHRAGDITTVTVEEGSVEVSSSQARGSWRAEAGYELTYTRRRHAATIAAVDASRALEWRNGELAYVREPLQSVVDDINRASSRKIVIQDPSVADLRFTGTAFTSGVKDWVKAIEQAYDVEASTAPNGDIVLRNRK